VPPTHCRLSGYFPGTPYIGVLLEWQPPQPLHTQRVGGKSQLASEGGGGHRGAGRKTPPFCPSGRCGGRPLRPKRPFPPTMWGNRGKTKFRVEVYPFRWPYLYSMQWLSAQQVREVVREVLGWEIHPNTLRKWVRAGKLRNYSPGGRRVFYPIEDVASLLRLDTPQLLAIVQKEKGGRP